MRTAIKPIRPSGAISRKRFIWPTTKLRGCTALFPLGKMRPERIVEMKDQFYTTIGQDPLPRRIIDRPIAFQRPNAFYKQSEGWMDWVFAIACFTHGVVDLIAFAPSGLKESRKSAAATRKRTIRRHQVHS
jgi:hypothetical protein